MRLLRVFFVGLLEVCFCFCFRFFVCFGLVEGFLDLDVRSFPGCFFYGFFFFGFVFKIEEDEEWDGDVHNPLLSPPPFLRFSFLLCLRKRKIEKGMETHIISPLIL